MKIWNSEIPISFRLSQIGFIFPGLHCVNTQSLSASVSSSSDWIEVLSILRIEFSVWVLKTSLDRTTWCPVTLVQTQLFLENLESTIQKGC